MRLGDAIRWVEEHDDARVAALREAGLTSADDALPDRVASDPALLATAAKELVVEAVRRDAPAGVVEALIVPARGMAETARNLDAYAYVTETLASLRGLRDQSEIEPVLTQALVGAPDSANATRIEQMIERIRSPIDATGALLDAEAVMLPPNSFSGEVACAVCCFVTCSLCGGGCSLCCVVACFLCR